MQSSKVPCRPGTLALAPRNHLVPGACACDRSVDDERKDKAACEIVLLAFGCGSAQRVSDQRVLIAAGVFLTRLLDRAHISRPRRLQARQQFAALLRIQSDVVTGRTLGQKLTPPCGIDIGPGLDGVDVTAGFGRGEACAPTIVVAKLQGNATPLDFTFRAPQQLGREHRVAVPEDVSPNLYAFPGDPFDRKTAGIDRRIDILDVNATA